MNGLPGYDEWKLSGPPDPCSCDCDDGNRMLEPDEFYGECACGAECFEDCTCHVRCECYCHDEE